MKMQPCVPNFSSRSFASSFSLWRTVRIVKDDRVSQNLKHNRLGAKTLRSASTSEHVLEDSAKHDSPVPDWGLPKELRKTKVALHVAYEGSKYRGLQINRESASGETVEHFLEQALFKVGGIRESNFGDLTRVGWNRASRTDKGVHSICSVVSLKMLCPEGGSCFNTDPEGTRLAEDINRHLPEKIRVLSCQRVVRSFRARQAAADRRYEYFLPARVIGIDGDDTARDMERLGLFQEALAAFEGTHAFHNYTTPQLYSRQKNSPRSGAKLQIQHRREPATGTEGGEADGSATSQAEGAGGPDRAQPSQDEGGELGSGGPAFRTTPRGSKDEDSGWTVVARWGPDIAESIHDAHYRNIRSIRAFAPEPLLPGSDPVIRVQLWGDSFMLHQIRKVSPWSGSKMFCLLFSSARPLNVGRGRSLHLFHVNLTRRA
uniref:tRNA pseudouridine38-40 synthase n=1 Tax=Tetraselmis sp. GSL018 TaxID=582737 RepID=A0A061SCQ4_9CHLO|mmetsp:Transcript_27767/g.65984  ORF Transcript_27767/g.65984 Transcript_27767/m.65984 type:complete len:431 (+) Transcript_27767:189-1481(+)